MLPVLQHLLLGHVLNFAVAIPDHVETLPRDLVDVDGHDPAPVLGVISVDVLRDDDVEKLVFLGLLEVQSFDNIFVIIFLFVIFIFVITPPPFIMVVRR